MGCLVHISVPKLIITFLNRDKSLLYFSILAILVLVPFLSTQSLGCFSFSSSSLAYR